MKLKLKDCQPIETIEKIRGILKDCGIFIYEPFWAQTNNFFFSVRIEIDGLPRGVNGKGTNRLFALASAYGELMERLQNRVLIPRNYGWKNTQETKSFPDEDYHNVEPFLINIFLPNNQYFGGQEELLELFTKRKSFNLCVPFYNINKDEIVKLPIRFVSLFCGTNGMSAGNTYEEAIVHGISEILERFVIKQVILEEISLPNIPLEYFKDFHVYPQIKELEKMGYYIFIKDCTLNGEIPVIGALIINPDKTGYCFRFGSEPVLEIALERCFTEMFQGVQGNINNCFIPIELNYATKSFFDKTVDLERFSKNGKGQLPNTIFNNAPYCKDNLSIFYGNVKEYSNKIGMQYLFEILKKENYQIYVRDLSFLDFPAFKIYIPGMSEIYLRNKNAINDYINVAKAAKVFLNINNSSQDEILLLINMLEKSDVNKSHSILKTEVFESAGLIFNVNDKIYSDIEINFFLCLLYIKVKNYKKAFNYLNDFLANKKNTTFANMDYYMCALAYLKLMAENKDNNFILDNLSVLFGGNIAQEVITDLNDESKLFMNCELPTCPNCEECPTFNSCKYQEWSYYNNKIIENMHKNFKTQKSLRNILESARVSLY